MQNEWCLQRSWWAKWASWKFSAARFVYDGFSSGDSPFTSCGESIMKRTRDTFHKLSSRLPVTATDRNIVQHSVWTVLAKVCATCFANDVRNLPVRWGRQGDNLLNERKNNVELYQDGSSSSTTSFRSFKEIAIRPLWKLNYGEELFVDLGKNDLSK